MPQHRLSDNEIQMVVCPQHKRWQLPQTIAGERLHDAVAAMQARIRKLDDACAEIDADKALTDIGKRAARAKLGAALLQEMESFKPFELAKRSTQADVEMLEARMTSMPQPPTEVADVMLQQEIRSWLRTQDQPLQTAYKSLGDARVLGAILHAPPVLSGLDDNGVNLLRQRARTSFHPKEVGVINELNKALSDLTEGLAAARRLISERTEVRADDDAENIVAAMNQNPRRD